MKARLIATGERAPSWVAQGFAEYQKRLSHWLPFELVEIEPGLRGKGRDPRRATEDEGKRVIAALPKNAYVVALDVPGRQLSSEQLAQRLEHWLRAPCSTVSRRPMTNSLLSQAGAYDPRSGIRWGGVTANGLTFSLGYDQGGRNGVWSNWSWHRLTGENVVDNTRARAMVGWYHKLIQRTDMRLDVGTTAMYWRYQKDLGGYSLGQGGYYSPQRYASLSLPVSFAWRNDNWSVRLDGSVSVSSARTSSISRYPDQALIELVIAQLEPQYGPLTLDQAGLYTGDSKSTGTGYRLYGAVERRLGDHFVLGAAGTLQRSRDFSPNSFQLYLRYTFKPWQGNLPLPVSPLVPYGEFR